MRLNLGCGNDRISGYVNVDKHGAPDVLHDLERFPWPWPDNCFEEVRAIHVLEHLGQTPDTFIGVMKELYRVCRGGARVHIRVPHPRHDNFLNDPTHVRAITPFVLALFSRKENLEWRAKNAANTPLALYHDVDFEIRRINFTLEERYQKQLVSGQISEIEIDQLLQERNNVASDIDIVIEVIKPIQIIS